jgi:hypothetical protein
MTAHLDCTSIGIHEEAVQVDLWLHPLKQLHCAKCTRCDPQDAQAAKAR